MAVVEFKKARFLQSSSETSLIPNFGRHTQEIAFVGRSNVGKSSLINHLTATPKLAHVSATPGKTQLINFFMIDDSLVLVDLPGYGFAQVPLEIKKKRGAMMERYFNERSQLKLLLLLIDSRREVNEEDLEMIRWTQHYQKGLFIIWTKCDKLSKNELQKQITTNLKQIQMQTGIESISNLTYSVKDNSARISLIQQIRRML